MIGIVKVALSRPLTFVVMAILIAALGLIAAIRTPVDMFPAIRIPVIAVAWQYAGLSPEEMSTRIIAQHERGLTTTVNDIEHIESQSLQGIGIIKVYFQPGTDIRTATAQVTSISQSILRQMPPGVNPPLILNYDASTVPILQLALSGKGLTEQQLFDIGQNGIRPQLVSVPGLSTPFPSGGRQRQVQIDLDPVALQARGLSAQDVGAAIAAQNQINPAGFFKSGPLQYNVRLNNAPRSIDGLNDIPIRVVNGATIYMRDVAYVRDGSSPQTNVVHVEGTRSALLTIYKNGAVSTLAIIDGVKKALPGISAELPDGLRILPVGDQSMFVEGAVEGVVVEGAIAALLTSAMILLFLGSWRSTLIIALSIPLSILSAIALLSATGQTLNVMTLGGLALAVGILVDDATVTIENINWHLEQGKPVETAILDGAAQIVTPAFVSLLCICIVFVPMFFLPGVSGFLFVPMALAVVYAMISSFILSRTLVPTMANYLLTPHDPGMEHAAPGTRLGRFQQSFERQFIRLRAGYLALLDWAMESRKPFIAGFLAIMLGSLLLTPFLGRNFFPSVDSGQMLIHVRVPVGTRIEESAASFDRIGKAVREIVPPEELGSIINNIGLPTSALNTAYANTGSIGPQDGDILITLAKGHAATATHVDRLRRELPARFPGVSFAFLPADMTSQILNFGAPAPIDIRVSGNNVSATRTYAEKLRRKVQLIPGIADVRIQQPGHAPQFDVDVDRSRIGQYGLTERDVTTSLGGTLAGTAQSAPVFFINPQNGVSYPVVAQTPEHMVDTVSALENVPVSAAGVPSQVLGGVAEASRSNTVPVVSRYALKPVINIFATTDKRDLGAVAGDVQKAIDELHAELPDGVTVTIGGQYQTMQTAFIGLGLGIAAAVILIYLLIVVNFQSWLDPFVIISALPAALAGIVWMLFITGTTLSVPALTGAIMCMGVATANSILVVSFARERLALHGNAARAAMESAHTRFRPVLMTALAMMLGMLPMALGLGEGGEQNAPLGRAVIGGLLFATVATLFFVPTLFSIVHGRRKAGDAPAPREPAHV
ncbi:MAG: RND transporter [Sphingomonas sp.]|nr:MAG: RND transporter [Sphingomonas sp.]